MCGDGLIGDARGHGWSGSRMTVLPPSYATVAAPDWPGAKILTKTSNVPDNYRLLIPRFARRHSVDSGAGCRHWLDV